MRQPLVTCVMMTCNRPRFARKSIELFQAQTYANKELLIIDDGAVDPEPLPRNVRRMRIDRAWITRKRVLGFTHARGELVCGWDDDDYFGPERLATQVRYMMDTDADACGFPLDYVVDVPEAKFSRARLHPDRIIKLHDGVAMGWRSVFTEPGFLVHLAKDGLYMALRDLHINGGKLVTLHNDGYFVYARHPHSVWGNSLDLSQSGVPVPKWIPQDMMHFWRDPRLVDEGIGAGYVKVKP